MNLISKSTTKNLLKKYNLRPNKRLGQNFLISQEVLEQVIQTANLSKRDVVLEIGPGLGTITQELAKRAKKVVAIEKDKKMVEILKETLKDYRNVEIIQGDILKFGCLTPKFGREATNYKVIANLPHYITSPVIRMFLELKNPPQEITLLIQKEVAQRICARPPKMSLLAVAIQVYSQPKIISAVSKKSFWPQPKVDSAIIKIAPHPPVIASKAKQSRTKFFQVVKAGFSSPRKQLVNNLSKGLNQEKEKIKDLLKKASLDSKIRAEELSIGNWQKLTQLMK